MVGTNTHTHARTHTHTHAHTHAHTHTPTHAHTCTHTHLSKHACTVQTQAPPPTQTQALTNLLLDQAVTHGALLTLMAVSVVEVVELTLVALVTHKALTTGTGAVAMALHGSRAHRVAVTG